MIGAEAELDKIVLELRDQGLTYAAIGREIGKSKERVRQILWQAQRKAAYSGNGFGLLSVRAKNCILNFLPNEEKPQSLDYWSFREWEPSKELVRKYFPKHRQPNLGKITLHEIKEWLDETTRA